MSISNLSTGLYIPTQINLDPKGHFDSLQDLLTITENEATAFFNNMLAFCAENTSFYLWREVVDQEQGLLPTNFTYPTGIETENFIYSNKNFNFFILNFSTNGGLNNASELPILDLGENFQSSNTEDALTELKLLFLDLNSVNISNIDLKSNGTPNQYIVELEWVDSDGNTQTTTDPTPITITGGGVNTTSPAFIRSPKFVNVLAITGQSNALGLAENSLATTQELSEYTNIKIFNNISGQFENLNIGSGNNFGQTSIRHGIELGVASNFTNRFPNETLYIIKYGVSATRIIEHLPQGSVYETFKNDFLDPAINNLLSNDLIPHLHFFFSQGEANAASFLTPLFYNSFKSFINNWKRNLGTNLKFIVPKIIELSDPFEKGRINEIFSFLNVDTKDVSVINSNDYIVKSGDNVHWGYEGFKQIALDVVDIISLEAGVRISQPLPYDFSEAEVDLFSDTTTGGRPQVLYIDKDLTNSMASEPNTITSPYHSLEEANIYMKISNNYKFEIIFLKEGNHTGSRIIGKKINFKTYKGVDNVILDFSTVTDEEIIVEELTQFGGADFNFEDGKIDLISTFTGTQYFMNEVSGRCTGYIGVFHFQSTYTNSANNFVLRLTKETNLRIKELIIDGLTNNYFFGFIDYSRILIEKITIIGNSGGIPFREISTNIDYTTVYLEIQELNIISGSFSSRLKTRFNSITGTGTVSSIDTIFNNCEVDDTIDITSTNISYISGTLFSNNPLLIPFSATSYIIENFSGKLSNLNIAGSSKIVFKGINDIQTTNNIINNLSSETEPVTIENGITNILQTNDSIALFTGNAANIGLFGILRTNSNNLSITPINYLTTII